jgi:hypothetical protein
MRGSPGRIDGDVKIGLNEYLRMILETVVRE